MNMLRPTIRRDQSRRGATMIEFSLSFVAFVILLTALVDLGRAVWTFETLNHAALSGARFAVVHGSGNPVINNGADETALAIRDEVRRNAIGLQADQVSVNTAYDPDNERGSRFTVTAQYSMPTIARFFFPDGTFALSAEVSGVVLQ